MSCNSSPCSPANTIYQTACQDPGLANSIAHILGLDSQFCQRRLNPGNGGFLVARRNSSGTVQIGFTEQPVVTLGSVTAIQGQTFGNFIVQGSDGIWRELNGPASANLFPRTTATGAIIFDTLPAATVPDPLTLANLSVTNTATVNNLTVGGTPNLSGLSTGTPAFQLGIDGSGNVIRSTPATTGTQSVMFFEAPTSPSPTTPNSGANPGDLLVIGNEINSTLSPGALITVTNSQTLTVAQAGFYVIDWCGTVVLSGNTSGAPSIPLLINGVNVNNGSSRTTGVPLTRGSWPITGVDQRQLAAGATIQLQLAAGSGDPTQIGVYEVRLRAQRIA